MVGPIRSIGARRCLLGSREVGVHGMKISLAAMLAATAATGVAHADVITSGVQLDLYPANPSVEAIRLARTEHAGFAAQPFAGDPFAGIPVGPLASPMDPSTDASDSQSEMGRPADSRLFDASPIHFWADVFAASTALAF